MAESQKQIKRKTAAIIFCILAAVTSGRGSGRLFAAEPNQSPSIGISTSHITFDKGITSKTFRVWHNGTGTLDYEVSVTEGEDYFQVEPNEGQSKGPLDTQLHRVTVDYNAMAHGETVTGLIEITSTSGDEPTRFIELIAQESIASHVRRVEIEQSIDYGMVGSARTSTKSKISWIEGDSGPTTWGISPSAPTAADVIQFSGPAGNFSNGCFAMLSAGGWPTVTIDRINRTVEIWFEPTDSNVCAEVVNPVCGLQGSFGPLEPGDWVFFCNGPKDVKGLSFAVPFFVEDAEWSAASILDAPCDSAIDGDLNCDGVVDLIDFCIFTERWANKSGWANFENLSIFCDNWLGEGRAGISYNFWLSIETDDTVTDVEFITPEGYSYQISDEEYTKDGSIETRHSEKDGVLRWTHQEWFSDFDELTAYWDGKYTIIVNYEDGDSAETIVGFGIPQQPGTIVQPTQKPMLIYPQYNADAINPIRFSWEKCGDPNAGSIRLGLEKQTDSNRIEQELSKGKLKTGPFNLEIGKWQATLSFGRWYQAQTSDGIEIEVGKCARSTSVFEVTRQFGTFGGNVNLPLKITDCNGAEVTLRLTGGGTGRVEGDCGLEKIILSGTTAKSVFSITTAGGVETTISDLIVNGDIKAIVGKAVDLEGDILIQGSAGMITLDDVQSTSNITIGPSESPKKTCLLRFDLVDDLNLVSRTPIRALRATDWLAGAIETPWISSLKTYGNAADGIAGDFGADLWLTGDNPKGMTLKKADIAGDIAGWSWEIIGNCGTIEFAGSYPDFEGNIEGDIGTLRAVGNKEIGTSSVLSGQWRFGSARTIKADNIAQCGISASGTDKEKSATIGKITAKGWIIESTIDAAGDVGAITTGVLEDCDGLSVEGTLGRLEIKGIKGEAYCLINSNVEANHIGNAILSYPKYFNDGVPFGVTTSSIDKLTVRDSIQKKTWKGLEAGAEAITTGDFEINLQ